MTNFFMSYLILWGLACVVAVVLMIRLRTTLELFQRTYWAGLLQDWKIVSFLVAATGLVIIAPYTGDPTWDYVDATFMSLLTYATAPWVVGTCYLTIRGMSRYLQTYMGAALLERAICPEAGFLSKVHESAEYRVYLRSHSS